MVQLKHPSHPDKVADRIAFQFQYGTIKTLLHVVKATESDLFQFQYGTIKTER